MNITASVPLHTLSHSYIYVFSVVVYTIGTHIHIPNKIGIWSLFVYLTRNYIVQQKVIIILQMYFSKTDDFDAFTIMTKIKWEFWITTQLSRIMSF